MLNINCSISQEKKTMLILFYNLYNSKASYPSFQPCYKETWLKVDVNATYLEF